MIFALLNFLKAAPSLAQPSRDLCGLQFELVSFVIHFMQKVETKPNDCTDLIGFIDVKVNLSKSQ